MYEIMYEFVLYTQMFKCIHQRGVHLFLHSSRVHCIFFKYVFGLYCRKYFISLVIIKFLPDYQYKPVLFWLRVQLTFR